MVKKPTSKTVETHKHYEARRRNIPTAEFESVLTTDERELLEMRIRAQ